MKKFAPALVLAMAATGVAAAPSLAHEAVADMGCQTRSDGARVSVLTVDAIKYDEGSPNHIKITLDGAVIVDTTFGAEYHLTTHRTGYTAHTARVVITAEGEYSPTFDLSSPACKERIVWSFAGRFLGPCEDPMHAAVLYNYSTRGAYMTWSRIDGGVRKVTTRWVPANSRVRTAFRHVDGRTRMVIKARGNVVAEGLSGKAGNYGPCPR